MAPNDMWLQSNGATLAAALEGQRDAICVALTARIASSFPMLCYDHSRFDGRTFQQQMLRRTPQRLHALMQSALRLQNLDIIEREYRWAWPLVQRYGVTRQHLIAQVYWYFEVSRSLTRLEDADRFALNELEKAVVATIEQTTVVQEGVVRPSPVREQRRRRNGHAEI